MENWNGKQQKKSLLGQTKTSTITRNSTTITVAQEWWKLWKHKNKNSYYNRIPDKQLESNNQASSGSSFDNGSLAGGTRASSITDNGTSSVTN